MGGVGISSTMPAELCFISAMHRGTAEAVNGQQSEESTTNSGRGVVVNVM